MPYRRRRSRRRPRRYARRTFGRYRRRRRRVPRGLRAGYATRKVGITRTMLVGTGAAGPGLPCTLPWTADLSFAFGDIDPGLLQALTRTYDELTITRVDITLFMTEFQSINNQNITVFVKEDTDAFSGAVPTTADQLLRASRKLKSRQWGGNCGPRSASLRYSLRPKVQVPIYTGGLTPAYTPAKGRIYLDGQSNSFATCPFYGARIGVIGSDGTNPAEHFNFSFDLGIKMTYHIAMRHPI